MKQISLLQAEFMFNDPKTLSLSVKNHYVTITKMHDYTTLQKKSRNQIQYPNHSAEF